MSKSWSVGNDLNTGVVNHKACGSITAGLSFGGYDDAYKNNTEEYDGTCWTVGGNLFTGTDFKYSSSVELKTDEDISSCYPSYNPKTTIHKNWIEMHIPSLIDVDVFDVKNSQKI